jgi:hypothetical protein
MIPSLPFMPRLQNPPLHDFLTHGLVQNFAFQTKVELHLSESWLSGSAWPYGQICRDF